MSGLTQPQGMQSAYLVVISDVAALAWVLTNSRMAFPEARRSTVEAMKVGDDIFIYTSRGCYHNTSRDRGLLVGQAKLANKPKLLDRPVVIGPRKFAYACKLQILGMAPLRKGVELASVVDQLEAFPQPAHWSARLRQPPLELTSHDAKLLNELLSPHLEPLKAHLSTYEAEAIRLAGRFH